MRRNLILLLVSLSIVFRLFTPFRLYISGGLALSMLIPVVALYTLGGLYKNRRFYMAGLVSAIPLFLSYIGVEYFEGYLPDSIGLMFAISCMEYYLSSNDEKFAKYALYATFVSLCLLSIISTPILLTSPGLNRMVNAMKAEGLDLPLISYFTIEYSNVHAVPILVMPLFFLYQHLSRKWHKVIVLVAIVTLYVTTILSNASAPMFMLFLYIIFLWLYNSKQSAEKNFLKIGGVLLLIFAVLGSGAIPSILRAIQPYLTGTMQAGRIDEVIFFLETGETSGDIEAREDLYGSSIDTFLSHPFSLEYSNNNIGHHTYLLDHLAAMGLIFFAPFAILLYRRYLRPMKWMKAGKVYYIMAFSAFLLLAFMKNFFVATSAMFIVPTFIIYIERHLINKNHVNKNIYQKSGKCA